jgi:hypothetical protein
MEQAEYLRKRKAARIAGLWYFVMLVTGIVGMLYAPTRIIVAGNAAETGANLIRLGSLFRIGILSSLVCQIAFVFLAFSLYGLLREVDGKLARLMLGLVLAAVPIAFLNEIFSVAAGLVKGTEPYLGALGSAQADALALLFLDIHAQGILLCGFFWGLWLLPFGLLCIRSGFLPKIIGYLLIAGCFAYLFDSTAAILSPGFRKSIEDVMMIPLALGEFSAIAWLLIKGVSKVPAR